MKNFRLLVLALLAMLLPLRGVTAAALLCEQQPMSHTEVVTVYAHDHDTAATPVYNHASHDHSHGGSDKSGHCLSSCTAAPLMAAEPSVLTPRLSGTAVFPHFAAPAPTFHSDGQDRPPRSI